ncbi:MAG TPA: NAD-binding protein, partial [Candidatus Eremiobacteraceae bacterium]|nr:NAD-binding protein [Candidatus Eremiobacteraceae bacterium]
MEGSRVSDMPSVAASIELSPQQAAPDPVDILVVGSDALGVDVCRLLHDAGRRVVAIWATDAPTLDDVQLIAIRCVAGDARRAPLLSRAGVRVAGTILAVTSDDQFNLRVALAARDLNPGIRIVLRQFNRRLGQKIVRQLANAEAVSPETHSAATYAASCLNPYVYHALEFPRYSEKLIAFCRGTAAQFAVAGASVGDVRRKRGWHVLAVGDRPFCDDETPVGADDLLTIACRVEAAPSGSIAPSGGDGSSATDAILFEHPRRGIA